MLNYEEIGATFFLKLCLLVWLEYDGQPWGTLTPKWRILMLKNRALGFALSIALGIAICSGRGLAQSSTSPSAGGVPAATTPAPTTPELTSAEVTEKNQMNTYLINHPGVNEQLQKDPSLINNPQWLAQHPAVQQYMNSHPTLQHLAAEHPDWAMKNVEQSARSQEAHEVKTTDDYLAKHPQLAKQLAANPNLINNKEFLAKHPSLEQELKTHPQIAYEAQHRPDASAHTAERYAKEHAPKPKANPAPNPKDKVR